ncbi:MAG: hypothetical protein VX475_05115, partial [Myxococcota bacterium]|nr:hypothetical protein [Myxococcota bacterium]
MMASFKHSMVALVALVGLSMAIVPGKAHAQEVEKRDHPASSKSFVLGPQIGVVAPQLFSGLGSWPIFGLEAGYILPFNVGSMERPLQLSLVGHFTRPGTEG